MTRRTTVTLIAVITMALGGWALGQQGPKPASPDGPFVVSFGGDKAILLEVKTGKTWWLHEDVNGRNSWLPVHKFEDWKELDEWWRHDHDEKLKRARESAKN